MRCARLFDGLGLALTGLIDRADISSHRNFLLFLPTDTDTPALKAVLSYYSSAVSLNAEGDTSIREDTLEGLGRSPPKFLSILFGAIVNITSTSSQHNSSFPSEAQQSPANSTEPLAEKVEEGTFLQAHFHAFSYMIHSNPLF